MKKILLFLGVLFLISTYFIYKKLNPPQTPSYLIESIGRIDGDLITLNTKYPARVEKIYFDIGDKVKKGDLIAKLDSKEFNEKLKGINFQIKAKNNELKLLIVKVNNKIQNSKNLVEIKKESLKILNNNINSLKSVLIQDKKDERRVKNLVKKKLAQTHELEIAKLKTETDSDKLNSLKSKKEILSKELEIAENNLELSKNLKKEIESLKNEILVLNSKKNEIQIIINELSLKSPIDGYVESKVSNEGEVLGAGGVVENLIDKNSFYLKIFVDEIENGKIKIGDKAEIFLDSYPHKPILAKVIKISQKAEFTPKDVAVKSDRITRVYEVHLKPLQNCSLFKLGLPAIGIILIDKNKTLPDSLEKLPVL